MHSIEHGWSKRLSTARDTRAEGSPPQRGEILTMILITAAAIGITLALAWADDQIYAGDEFYVPAVVK